VKGEQQDRTAFQNREKVFGYRLPSDDEIIERLLYGKRHEWLGLSANHVANRLHLCRRRQPHPCREDVVDCGG